MIKRFTVLLVVALAATAVAMPQSSATSKKKPSAAHSASSKARKKKTAAKKHLTPAQRAALARRASRARRAFVASSELKPMAQQLLEMRTPAAYSGVEAWARKHAATDAGSLAWLVIGYAHYNDRQFDEAVPAFQKAQPHAGEVADYAAYFLASSYLAQGQSAPAMDILKSFGTRYSDSLFARDAALLYANALITTGDPQRAVVVLEPYEGTGHPEIELARGRAYLKAGDTEKGAALLRKIYFSMPASAQAQDARAELERAGLFSGTFAEERERAEALESARRYSDAVNEYRGLIASAPAEKQPELQVLLSEALYKANNRSEARAMFQRIPESNDEAGARRNYYLLEIARSDGDEGQVRAILDRMRTATPASAWLQQALHSAGNMYLLKKDYAQAAELYREIYQRFPQSKVAANMHWKTAWLTLRQGKVPEAKALFEEQVRDYPESSEVAPAIYWRARLAEDDHEFARARAWYRKETERFRNYYYAELARTRLEALGEGDVAIDPLLARVPQPPAPHFVDEQAPADNLRLQKSRLLENGAMFDFAVRELQLAASDGEDTDGARWVNREIARVYQASGRYDRALESLKHAVPSYFALDMGALPRPYWEALFPRPFWTDLTRYATANQLDPFLVASLIRQESEFNPGAISPANAWGLMQVLPSTGKMLARELRIGHFSDSQLLVPATNLELGTRHFKALVDRFNGKVEYALAAYNAGENRVDDWLAAGQYRDTAEFVESIPFTETREYVQAILRNAMVYRQLYGAKLTQAKAEGN